VTQTIALSQRFGYNLRQHVSASESAQLKQQHFLNSISHEIRTPMNAILGMLEFVDDSDLNKEQRSKLETVRKNSQDLNKILLDLLNFSAFDSGKLKLEKVKFSFRELVKNACEHAELRAKESKVEFDLHIDEEIPDEIVGDAEKLEQVIYHIVGNAFKFTEKGKISLRVELKDCEDNQLKLKYTVTDTGIGIHSDQLERVLNDFSQGEEGNTRKYGGTGIGLSLSARIVEHMGGELWIDSQFGKGTIVEWETNLATPRIDLSAKAQELKQDHAKIEGNIHILYAEDNPINQKLMVMMLKNLGLEVDTALNGLEAWEMALTKSYHVIFMDVQMPKMDGIESTRRIIKDVRQRPIIIAVTANAEVADQKRCIEAGMNDFISKPFTAKNIKDALIKWQGLIRYMEEDGNKDVLRIIS
jgi:CheY-like chemotaxis protein/anti-sigma regulatory factor (Ser/Thr protein kinase)